MHYSIVMDVTAFRLPIDLPRDLRASSYDGRITRVPLPQGSELFFTAAGTDAYREDLRMIRFGALLRSNAKLMGVAYGNVFKVRAGSAAPSSEVFYDWCDSVDSDTAQVARWILDSGRFDELFQHGDAVTFDAHEFLPNVGLEAQRVALRGLATALQRRFPRLARALIVVHPCRLGEPPKTDASIRRIKAYRRALEAVMSMARELRLGDRLRPKSPAGDLLIGRNRSIDFNTELFELACRTGLFRDLAK